MCLSASLRLCTAVCCVPCRLFMRASLLVPLPKILGKWVTNLYSYRLFPQAFTVGGWPAVRGCTKCKKVPQYLKGKQGFADDLHFKGCTGKPKRGRGEREPLQLESAGPGT